MRGRRLTFFARSTGSRTTRDERPVTGSVSSKKFTPSIRSAYSTRPDRSVMIGRVNGSHSASFWPRATCAPSSVSSRAP